MLLYLGIIVLFAILLGIFLWYTRVHKKSVWYNIKLLFKAYDAACTKVTVNGSFITTGFCNTLRCMPTVDYDTKQAIIAILSKEITIKDIYWKVRAEQISEDNLIKQLSSINVNGSSGIYWFPAGDVSARRDFLYKVLKKHGKLK